MNAKDLRIVFMGTPDFAVEILKKLLENQYHVVGVVTAADKPAGRGKQLISSAVKKFALEHQLPVLQPVNLKNPDFLNDLTFLKPDLQIVVAFRMLPQTVWSLPKFGTFNLHASLLPAYRGAAPINWAIINGETKTGVTTFFIDEKIDTGAIILQEKMEITVEDSVGTLHDKLAKIGGELVLKTVNLIAQENVTTQKQPEIAPSLAPKLTKENTRIDWKSSAKEIYDFIRGLSPYPVAWTGFKNDGVVGEFKIFSSTYTMENHSFEIGRILTSKNELKIAVKDGFLNVQELQLPNRKKMDVKSLLNGYRFAVNARVDGGV